MVKPLSLFIFLFISFTNVFAQTAIAPSIGTGTPANPYEIASLENLFWIQDNTANWDKHYIQTADINASATSTWNSNTGWMPIGNATTRFTGSYNGQGFEISGLRINRSSNLQGLFGEVRNATLLNIKIVAASISGSSGVGGIAGKALLTYINGCDVINSTITASSNYAGGWVGEHTYTLDSIHVVGKTISAIVSGSTYVGGFFGSTNTALFFEDCVNNGNISATGQYSGGFVGE
jgi:hypothetical protein